MLVVVAFYYRIDIIPVNKLEELKARMVAKLEEYETRKGFHRLGGTRAVLHGSALFFELPSNVNLYIYSLHICRR
jgi:hypothetical protein